MFKISQAYCSICQGLRTQEVELRYYEEVKIAAGVVYKISYVSQNTDKFRTLMPQLRIAEVDVTTMHCISLLTIFE